MYYDLLQTSNFYYVQKLHLYFLHSIVTERQLKQERIVRSMGGTKFCFPNFLIFFYFSQLFPDKNKISDQINPNDQLKAAINLFLLLCSAPIFQQIRYLYLGSENG